MSWPNDTRAIGQLSVQNPEDAALGLNGCASILILRMTGGPCPGLTWRVEAGERRLFGIEGLKVDGISFVVRRGKWGGAASAVHLGTPVGSETLVSLEPFYFGGEVFAFAAGVNLSRLSIAERPGVNLAAVSARLFARISDGFVLGYLIENIRFGGERLPGVDGTFYAVVFARSAVCVVTRLEVTRNGTVTGGIATRLRLGGSVRAAAGFDEATGKLAGAVTIGAGRVGIRVGAETHPVLGVTRSVSLVIGSGWR